MSTKFIILNDGETFTDLKGCKLVVIDKDVDIVDVGELDGIPRMEYDLYNLVEIGLETIEIFDTNDIPGIEKP